MTFATTYLMSQSNIFPAESWVASIADKHFRAFTISASFTDAVCKRDRSNAALFAKDGFFFWTSKGFKGLLRNSN